MHLYRYEIKILSTEVKQQNRFYHKTQKKKIHQRNSIPPNLTQMKNYD